MKAKKNLSRIKGAFTLVALCFSIFNSNLYASTAPNLGTSENFAVLAGSTVTNTGSSIVNGDLGLSPGSAIIGFPPGLVSEGSIHGTDAIAAQAQLDATAAYINLSNQSCDFDLSGQDLGGLTLTKGTYCFSSSAQLTGALILDAEGDPNAVFIFQTGSTLTTANHSTVSVINAGTACNIFWQIGSSATLNTDSYFIGNIFALTSITINSSSKIQGRAFARNGAVTMNDNLISKVDCSVPQANNNFYDYNCVYTATDVGDLSCLASGVFCIENPLADFPCPAQAYAISVTCDDGLSLVDSAAQIYYYNMLLMIQGEQLTLTAMIEILNLNNEVGVFQSNLKLEKKNFYKQLSGSCELTTSTVL